MSWEDDQKWEREWWHGCANTFYEEQKQLEYAPKMGLVVQNDSHGPFIDMEGKSVIDIGGGPVSLLLKCRNLKDSTVVDPCSYPVWVRERYDEAKIAYFRIRAENYELVGDRYDECWIYNVLQHVEDPAKVVSVALEVAKIVRVFDWLEIGVTPGHPQNLTKEQMNEWFGGEGKVEPAHIGKKYYGIFKGNHYEDSHLSG